MLKRISEIVPNFEVFIHYIKRALLKPFFQLDEELFKFILVKGLQPCIVKSFTIKF